MVENNRQAAEEGLGGDLESYFATFEDNEFDRGSANNDRRLSQMSLLRQLLNGLEGIFDIIDRQKIHI